jgi:hypothetical protein
MSEDPKRLLDDPDTADPELAARLRSDLRIAKDSPPGYDVEGGLARLSAAIAGGSGGGHQGGGSGPGAQGSGSGSVVSSGAAGASGALGAKLGLAGLLALAALGGALAVSSATQTPSNASEATVIALPAPLAPSIPSIDEPPSEAPRALEIKGAGSSAGPLAAPPRGAQSAVPAAGSTIKPEMDQLAEIRNALGSEPGRALALADEGHARFPRGVFWQEREEAAINALMKLGRSREAKARARVFVTRHPESPLAEEFRRVLQTPNVLSLPESHGL